MEAAILALRRQAPLHIVVAVPVGARDTCERLRVLADEVVCAQTPEPFDAVGLWYDDFGQTSDDEVNRLLVARRSHGQVVGLANQARGHLQGGRGCTTTPVWHGATQNMGRRRVGRRAVRVAELRRRT